MFAEVFTITTSAIDENDIRGHGLCHEQEYAADGTGSRKKGPRYYRRLDQAQSYLLPIMFKNDGTVAEDANHKPLVGTITKLHVEFPDDDFEPQAMTGKPLHKRGHTHIADEKAAPALGKDGPRIVEIRQYTAKAVAIPYEPGGMPFKHELVELTRLAKPEEIAKFHAAKK